MGLFYGVDCILDEPFQKIYKHARSSTLIRVHTFNQYNQQHLMYNKHKTYYRNTYNNLVVIKYKLSYRLYKNVCIFMCSPVKSYGAKNFERARKVYYSTA